MIEHNSPEGYKGVTPKADNIMIHPSFHATPKQRDGLYYRSDLAIDIDLATERLVNGLGLVQDYQYWADQAWKKEHGTYEAVERFGAKLFEEHAEFATELQPLSYGEAIDGDKLIAEAGDVLWCATALASCATADLDAACKTLLFRYLRGVQHIDPDGGFVEPAWRSKAAALATKYDQLTTADIDQLLEAGFEPLFSPVMNIYDPDDDEGSAIEHLRTSLWQSIALRNETEAQYGWNGDSMILPGHFQQKSDVIGELVAGLFLEISWITRKVASVGLSKILRTNVQKVNSRVATQTVDKSDGERGS